MRKLRLCAVVPLVVFLYACGGASTSSSEAKPNSQVEVASTATTAPAPCVANASWITSPNPPTEIGNGVPINQETNCQFYQFSYQWFFSLVQPTSTAGERQFETLNLFQPNVNN